MRQGHTIHEVTTYEATTTLVVVYFRTIKNVAGTVKRGNELGVIPRRGDFARAAFVHPVDEAEESHSSTRIISYVNSKYGCLIITNMCFFSTNSLSLTCAVAKHLEHEPFENTCQRGDNNGGYEQGDIKASPT
jgi:hypothetical protein